MGWEDKVHPGLEMHVACRKDWDRSKKLAIMFCPCCEVEHEKSLGFFSGWEGEEHLVSAVLAVL